MKSFITIIILSFTFFTNQNFVEKNSNLKTEAFKILNTKCNVCHKKKNRNRVFTIDNMDKNAKRIYRQVFVWKRMPKGKDIKLTNEEYHQLKNWLTSINIK